MVATLQRRRWLWGPLSFRGLCLACLVVAADQLHKAWMLGSYNIQGKGQVAVLPFLDLVHRQNKGVSFGLFEIDSTIGQWFWAGFAFLAVCAMAVWLARGDATRLG